MDASEAFHYYEQCVPGLGEDFLSEYRAALSLIAASPEIYRKTHKDFRRILLRRFSYAVYFQSKADLVIVFLLFQGSQNPAKLKRLLRTREEL